MIEQDGPFTFPDQPPADLVDALQRRECILFGGSRLSEDAGYPSWEQLVSKLSEWSHSEKIIDQRTHASNLKSIEAGSTDFVADSIAAQARKTGREAAMAGVLSSVLRDSPADLTPLHKTLASLPFTAVLTPAYDDLLERAFVAAGKQPHVYTLLEEPTTLEEIRKRNVQHSVTSPFIIKLRGQLSRPESVLLSQTQYQDNISGNEAYADFIAGLFLSRTLLFVGSSLDEILRFVEPLRIFESKQEHYALISHQEQGWEQKAALLERRYNISVFAFRAMQDSELVFLRGLLEQDSSTFKGIVAEPRQRMTTWLARVRLTNIGPFESLELKLDRHWNILLGNNGVGKSNIIKAIAVGMLGRDAMSYADRILRFGQSSGKIVLETNEGKEYSTQLTRTSSGTIEIRTLPGKILDIENWLALGFPPVRTVTWQPITSPTLDPGHQRARPDDLLPLVNGMPDPRLDSVKQWFAKTDYFRKSDPDGNYKQQLDEMARVIRQVTGGLKMSFKEVDLTTGQIYFETDDGIVPIDAVSQGTASLSGWVGFLTQRMFDVYSAKTDSFGKPLGEYAMVLIDEIDAHMHPAWQQALVTNLKELFPGVQFIATTHSPFIPISSKPEEIMHLQRDASRRGRIYIEQSALDVQRWRADQVLTSPLFGLGSTNLTLHQWAQEYTDLLAKDELTKDELKRVDYLASMMEIAPPEPFERDEARLAFTSIEKALDEQIAAIPEEKKEKIRREAKVQLLESITRRRRPL